MIFGTQSGKVAHDGGLIQKFFEKYNKVKHLENPGWELILNDHFADSSMIKLCTLENKNHLKRIKFLNPQPS